MVEFNANTNEAKSTSKQSLRQTNAIASIGARGAIACLTVACDGQRSRVGANRVRPTVSVVDSAIMQHLSRIKVGMLTKSDDFRA